MLSKVLGRIHFSRKSSPTQIYELKPLAEGVFGRDDVTRTYIGRELNTKHMFGSFSDNSFYPDVQTLLGAPPSHETIR